jgi:hypothetical protein
MNTIHRMHAKTIQSISSYKCSAHNEHEEGAQTLLKHALLHANVKHIVCMHDVPEPDRSSDDHQLLNLAA